jgi:hypothetical protein
LDSANEFAIRCLHYDKTKEFGNQMLISIKIARSENKTVPAINREEINRAVNTSSASLAINSIMKHSTPATMNYSPRSV